MTALRHDAIQICIRDASRHQARGIATHQEATLLALHFRSANWTPCHSAPALIAAAATIRAMEFPAAQWDVWFFGSGDTQTALCNPRTATRRTRLEAEARASQPRELSSPWFMIAEERLAPRSATPARRLLVELTINPFGAREGLAPVDPRAAATMAPLPARTTDHANPPPDLTIDLAGMGLVAPRAMSW